MIPKSETKEDQSTIGLIIKGQNNLVILLKKTMELLPIFLQLALEWKVFLLV